MTRPKQRRGGSRKSLAKQNGKSGVNRFGYQFDPNCEFDCQLDHRLAIKKASAIEGPIFTQYYGNVDPDKQPDSEWGDGSGVSKHPINFENTMTLPIDTQKNIQHPVPAPESDTYVLSPDTYLSVSDVYVSPSNAPESTPVIQPMSSISKLRCSMPSYIAPEPPGTITWSPKGNITQTAEEGGLVQNCTGGDTTEIRNSTSTTNSTMTTSYKIIGSTKITTTKIITTIKTKTRVS
jgi:hypothetical protein